MRLKNSIFYRGHIHGHTYLFNFMSNIRTINKKYVTTIQRQPLSRMPIYFVLLCFLYSLSLLYDESPHGHGYLIAAGVSAQICGRRHWLPPNLKGYRTMGNAAQGNRTMCRINPKDLCLQLKGYLFIMAAAVLWGVVGPFSRLAFSEGIGPMEVAFWRAALAWIFFGTHAVLTGRIRIRAEDHTHADPVCAGRNHLVLQRLSVGHPVRRCGPRVRTALYGTGMGDADGPLCLQRGLDASQADGTRIDPAWRGLRGQRGGQH